MCRWWTNAQGSWKQSVVLALILTPLFSAAYLMMRKESVAPLDRETINTLVAREVREQLVEVTAVQKRGASSSSFTFPIRALPQAQRKRILVTGGAGFVGSHLVDKLMMEGHEVVVLDNFFTGRRKNVEHWIGHPNFELVDHDVTEPFFIQVDQIYHLACPASPPHYQFNPIKTLKTSTLGTLNALGLARRVKARILFTSTSEIYGDPEIHPQVETYWGNVNPIGPRACYDEGKRVAESMMYAYEKQEGVEVRVARIFNTYGPRMHPNDGRVVSNFIIQALRGEPMTIYGDGKHTRCFQYVSDLVDGLYKLMNSDYSQPVNIGNPVEVSIFEFAKYIRETVNPSAEIVNKPASQDDPHQRKPDISRARKILGWEPKVDITTGIKKTVEYFRQELISRGETLAARSTDAQRSAT